MTNNVTFADRAVAEMLNCTAWDPDWNPKAHFLDTAELMHGVGMAYDALYDVMSATNRSRVASGLASRGLAAFKSFHGSAWWYKTQANWGGVCNGEALRAASAASCISAVLAAPPACTVAFREGGPLIAGGAIVAALALADDPEHGPAAAEVLQLALAGIPYAMSSYGPDGLWPEGPTYEDYMSRYAIAAIESMLNAGMAAEAASLMASPGFNLTCLTTVVQQGMGTQQFFDWSDSETGPEAHPNLFWFAERFNQPACAYLAERQSAYAKTQGLGKAAVPTPGDGRATLGTDVNSVSRNLLYFTGSGTGADLQAVGLDTVYRLPTDFPHSGMAAAPAGPPSPPAPMVAVFHRVMDDNASAHGETAMLGFKAGYNGANHGHLDAGSFVFDSSGVRVAGDLGAGSYALPGYFGGKRWDYFRTNSSGHNVLRFGGRNQNTPVVTAFTRSYGTFRGPWQVADLTPAYKRDGIVSVLRGASLVNSRRQMLVVDNVVATSTEEVVWQMNTPLTNVTGPHVAALTGNTYFELSFVMGGGGRLVTNYVVVSKRSTACKGLTARPPFTPQLSGDQRPVKGMRIELVAPSAADCKTIAVVVGPADPSMPWDIVTDVTQWADKGPIHTDE